MGKDIALGSDEVEILGLVNPSIEGQKSALFRAIAECAVTGGALQPTGSQEKNDAASSARSPKHHNPTHTMTASAFGRPSTQPKVIGESAVTVDNIVEAMEQREMLGHTASDYGIAFPRATVEGLTKIVVCITKLAEPLAYEDGAMVDLVVTLLTPSDGLPQYNQLLTSIVQQLRDEQVQEKLRLAASPRHLCSIMREEYSVAA
ncbi:MAG: PTS sugar transporter subunit IIA [Alphaproteobacteria bacterium]|nr:PTS sugar transporter subunit IIA [Alphaproteobacteria bacterium]